MSGGWELVIRANKPDIPTDALSWVPVHGFRIPQGALVGGEEDGRPIYIARAFHKKSLQVGRAASHLKKGAAIGFEDREIDCDGYEILEGLPNQVRWVNYYGPLNVNSC